MHSRVLVPLSLIGIAALLLPLACSTQKTPEYDRAALLSELASDVMLQGYEQVAEAAAALHTATSALCEAPSESALEAAQAAYRTLFLDWQKTLTYRFGPARDDNLGPEMAFSPANTDAIEADIAGDDALTDDAIDALGGGVKGLYALAYLLYADGAQLASEDAPRRCQYTDLLAGHVERTSEQLADGWRPSGGGFANTLASAGQPDNTRYPAELSAVSVVMTGLLTALESVKDDKLGAPLGLTAKSDGTDITALESPYAHLSLEAMQANLEGVREVWTGTTHNFDAYLRTRNTELADRVLSQLSAAEKALDEVPAPLSEYIASDDHEAGETAYAKLGELVRTISADVDAALAVSLMFNENDGD